MFCFVFYSEHLTQRQRDPRISWILAAPRAGYYHWWDPMQNENVGPLVQKAEKSAVKSSNMYSFFLSPSVSHHLSFLMCYLRAIYVLLRKEKIKC